MMATPRGAKNGDRSPEFKAALLLIVLVLSARPILPVNLNGGMLVACHAKLIASFSALLPFQRRAILVSLLRRAGQAEFQAAALHHRPLEIQRQTIPFGAPLCDFQALGDMQVPTQV